MKSNGRSRKIKKSEGKFVDVCKKNVSNFFCLRKKKKMSRKIFACAKKKKCVRFRETRFPKGAATRNTSIRRTINLI